MIRTKTNFVSFRSDCSGSGKTTNDLLLDGSVALGAYSEKVTPSTLAEMSPLEQQTPYQVDQMPDVVRAEIDE